MWYIEADMAIGQNSHTAIWNRHAEMLAIEQSIPNNVAFVTPCFTSKGRLPKTKADFERDSVVPIAYTSHRMVGYNEWREKDEFMGYDGSNHSPQILPSGQEPYFIARKDAIPPYDALYGGMLGDKVEQLNDMRAAGFRFVLHPDAFVVNQDSEGLGDSWITKKTNWRVGFVRCMHAYSVQNRMALETTEKRGIEDTPVVVDLKTGLVTHPFREEWMVYDVRKGGAYLFFPATDARHHSEHGSVNGWTTTTPHWSRTIVDRGNGVYDFEYSVELTERNKEWFVRFNTGVQNKGVFHTDLNGFNFDRHVFRSDRPIQAQVYPMPTLACIEDEDTRFTVPSEHAQGAASLSEGTVDVWLDRRLGQDDARGVGQGVQDNVRVKTTLRVVVEEGVGMEEEFAPTEWVKKQWAELNQPLEMFQTRTPHQPPERRLPNRSPSVLYEERHDQWSKTNGHRIDRFIDGSKLTGDTLNANLIQVLIHVRNYLDEHQIEYTLKSGTLLGAWRHHGFIPWDTDNDILLLHEDCVRLKEALHKDPPHSKQWQWIVRAGLHSDIITMKVADINTGYYVDIFEAHVDGSNALDRWWNPPRKYPLNVLRPTIPCIYEGEVFKCPHDSKALLDIIYDNNIGIPTKYKNVPHPPIYNSILTPPSQQSIPIVIMAHKRVEYMKQTMESIDASDIPKNTPIIVSHDGHVPEMMEYLDSIEDQFNLTRIYHPWACYEHPNSFPGNDAALNEGYAGDQYGNPRSEWATCAKHHWWWMMQTVWDMGYDTMCFTEEDYEVAPTIYQTIETGLGLCDGDCFGVLLQPKHEVGEVWVEEAFQTGPMVLRRSSWEALWAAKKDFCEFDDYGWDWSVVHTMAVGKVPYKMVAPGKRQVRHIGAKGMHGREVVGAALSEFGGTELRSRFKGAQRPAQHRGNGGWGHSRDHEHCLSGRIRKIQRLQGTNTETSCDRLFGKEAVSDHGTCLHHSVLGWNACHLGKVQINPAFVIGSLGNESVETVMGHFERSERLEFEKGSIVTSSSWPSNALDSIQPQLGEFSTSAPRITLPTLLVRRGDYANPCMTMAKLYNVFVAMRHWNLQEPNIVWLDGNAHSNLDSIWTTLYGDVRHVKRLGGPTVFQDLRVVNVVSAFGDEGISVYHWGDRCRQDSHGIQGFRDFVLERYGVKRATAPQQRPRLSFLVSRDYVGHPRSNGMTDRTIEDEAAAVEVLRKEWPEHDIQVYAFETMPFLDQLRVVASTDVFVGVHGAGNVHVLFLPDHATFVEYVPPRFEGRVRFKYLASCLGIRYVKKDAYVAKRRGSGKISVQFTK